MTIPFFKYISAVNFPFQQKIWRAQLKICHTRHFYLSFVFDSSLTFELRIWHDASFKYGTAIYLVNLYFIGAPVPVQLSLLVLSEVRFARASLGKISWNTWGHPRQHTFPVESTKWEGPSTHSDRDVHAKSKHFHNKATTTSRRWLASLDYCWWVT